VKFKLLSQSVLLLAAAAALAPAQQFPLQLLVTQAGSAITIPNGATLVFSASIGQTQSADVRATHAGSGPITFSNAPSVFGSTAFQVVFTQSLPVTLQPGESFTFTIQFRPVSAAQSNAQLSFPFQQTLPPSGATGPTTVTNAISLTLQGTAPSLVLSYVLQTDQNVIPLQPGGAILFPPTLVNSVAQAALNLTNVGSGPGAVTSITITGSAYRLAGLPLLPLTLGPGQNLQVLVRYQPTEVDEDVGEITIGFAGGAPVTISLQGNGSASRFVYQILESDPPVSEGPGGTLPFPETTVGESNSLVIRVLNAGNATGTISSLNVIGQSFQIVNAPILPQALAPDASVTFTIAFTPVSPGALTGRLIVNSDIVNLGGTGLGPRLVFSYVTGGTTVTLGPGNNSVIFSPVIISQVSQVDLDIRNTGTQPATISNIGIGQTGGPFTISSPPPMPFRLASEESLRLTIIFRPTTLGFSNGTLQVDTISVGLVGSGTQPPPLPAYTISGVSGTVSALSQPNISLILENPYPVAIAGILTLGVSSDLPPDPAVQFATGGRTVPFVIPANSAEAEFGTLGTRIGLQTGTVASAMTLTPSFATQAGNVDLNPSTIDIVRFNVAPTPPVLISVDIASQAVNSVTIRVSGYTTARTLQSWRLELTPAPGVKMSNTQFTLDVQQIASAWFQNTASRNFGGQFSMSIPVTFQLSGNQTILNVLSSVSVALTNELGSSNSLQVNVR
jgi:hypothetical protein